ncbi:sugar kinase [Cellulomonas denverensis]|nr:sugar kinase [Cellulomonas denverensis]
MDAMPSSDILSVLRDGRPRTKTEIAELTGRVRSTVSLRLAELIEDGLVTELPASGGLGRGRPSARFAMATQSRVIGAVELGARHALVAMTDLTGVVLRQERLRLDVRRGPVEVLDLIVRALGDQLDAIGRPAGSVVGIGLGVPGPVDPRTSTLTAPPLMPGWDSYDIAGHLRSTFPVPVIVDNDVNVMAVGEWVTRWPDEQDLLVVKVATGIGAGVIAAGRLVQGARGAGGDIGHIPVEAAGERPCGCAQVGCLETFASGRGIAMTLREQGVDVTEAVEVVALVHEGDPAAMRAARDAGGEIGRVLSVLVAGLNPAAIVLGGDVAEAGQPLLAGVREAIYARAQPIATNAVEIVISADPEGSTITGAARLVQNYLFGLPERPVVYYQAADQRRRA